MTCDLPDRIEDQPMPAPTLTQHLLEPLAADPHAPRLVHYGPDGRAELSTATLTNWSAKVAGLLTDELGLDPGDRALLRPMPGWLTAPILLGCWWAGVTVRIDDAADPTGPFAVAFLPDPAGAAGASDSACESAQDAGADEVLVVSAHPLALPSRQLLPHQRDFSTAVLAQADRYQPFRLPDPAEVLLELPRGGGTGRTTDHAADAEAGLNAEALLAGTPRWDPPARVLTAAGWDAGAGAAPSPVRLWVGVLASGGTLVQVTDPALTADPAALDRIAEAENVTERA